MLLALLDRPICFLCLALALLSMPGGKSISPSRWLSCLLLRVIWAYCRALCGRDIEVFGYLEGVFSLPGALFSVITLDESAHSGHRCLPWGGPSAFPAFHPTPCRLKRKERNVPRQKGHAQLIFVIQGNAEIILSLPVGVHGKDKACVQPRDGVAAGWAIHAAPRREEGQEATRFEGWGGGVS